MDGNELRLLLCRARLKDCRESLAVFERHLLVELFARFQQSDFLWCQFRLSNLVADIESRHRESDKLVGLAVDADIAGNRIPFCIFQVDNPAEVACRFQHLLVFLRELYTVELIVEIGFLTDKVRDHLDASVGILVQ